MLIFVNVDMFMGFDENDGDDGIREEFLCPFCSEYFDIVGLCCHIDEEHPMEARNGVWILSFAVYQFSMQFVTFSSIRCLIDAQIVHSFGVFVHS